MLIDQKPDVRQSRAGSSPGGGMEKAVLGGLLALAVAAVVGLTLLLPRATAPLALHHGAALASPIALPAFILTDHRGTPFTRADLKGRWSLVFPGFTHCPDICPATLAILDRTQALLGPRGSELQVMLLSVDPERDTPEALARYLEFFNPGFVGVTGEQDQLQRLYEGLGVQHIRIPGAGGEYSVDHSAALLLINPEGSLVGYFMPPFQPERLATDLGSLLANLYQS